MNSDTQEPTVDAEWKLRYGSSRVPRVVDVPDSALSCTLLPPPVQIVRNASPEQQEAVSSQKPAAYLLLKFENRKSSHSTPFADLSDLR